MSQDMFMVLETIDTTGLNIPAVFYFAVTILGSITNRVLLGLFCHVYCRGTQGARC